MVKRSMKVVAEICLYGRDHAGYIARTADGCLFGDGEPVQGRSMTAATWLACLDLRAAGLVGLATVYAPGGKLCGEVEINHPCYFGQIDWRTAGVYVISAEAIEAAASK